MLACPRRECWQRASAPGRRCTGYRKRTGPPGRPRPRPRGKFPAASAAPRPAAGAAAAAAAVAASRARAPAAAAWTPAAASAVGAFATSALGPGPARRPGAAAVAPAWDRRPGWHPEPGAWCPVRIAAPASLCRPGQLRPSTAPLRGSLPGSRRALATPEAAAGPRIPACTASPSTAAPGTCRRRPPRRAPSPQRGKATLTEHRGTWQGPTSARPHSAAEGMELPLAAPPAEAAALAPAAAARPRPPPPTASAAPSAKARRGSPLAGRGRAVRTPAGPTWEGSAACPPCAAACQSCRRCA
mmetsp:Transcript_108703/g.325156  ORF Transcript_108703/g.325156 Transcript_108703/m.325156 type:complete len:300 (-) Transcript_108703:414-1313(-)